MIVVKYGERTATHRCICIEALEEVLQSAGHSNYKCVRIDEMIRGDRQTRWIQTG
jgi:hypothetical protein